MYANRGMSRMLIAEINNNEKKNKSTLVGSLEAKGRVPVFEAFSPQLACMTAGFHSNTSSSGGKV